MALPHRYWRLRNIAASSTGGQAGMGQIIMATSPGGAQECVGGTPFASSSYGGGLAASQSFTGVAGNNWFAPGDSYLNQWIGYDFGPGVEFDIVEVRVTGAPSSISETLSLFQVEYSDDGLNYDPAWICYHIGWADGSTYITFSKPVFSTINQYWAILSTNTYNNGKDLLISEAQFRDTIGGPTITGTGTPFYFPNNGAYPAIQAFDNILATTIYAGVSGKGVIVAYDFNAPVSIVEIAMISDSGSGNENRAPSEGRMLYSQDGRNWGACGTFATGVWGSYELKAFPIEFDIQPALEMSEGRVMSVFSAIAGEMIITGGRVMAVHNFPTEEIRLAGVRAFMAAMPESAIDMSAARVLAVVRGRVDNPSLRVWTFTLDGHDFFVLRLGDQGTLLYDTYSEQWVEWESKDSGAWRPNVGMTWVGAVKLGEFYGSNVVAGDDTFGRLWFLHPQQPFDDHPFEDRAPQQIPIQRIVTGQVLATARQAIPCYTLFLDGDNYGVAGSDVTVTDFTPGVTLETSDDQGRNFVAHDTLTITPDTRNQVFAWYSLGQIEAPGRMFRITDNGVFTRIDGLGMNDAG